MPMLLQGLPGVLKPVFFLPFLEVMVANEGHENHYSSLAALVSEEENIDNQVP